MKSVSQEGIKKSYDPRVVEKNIYEYWTVQEYFTYKGAKTGDVVSLVTPPVKTTEGLCSGNMAGAVLQDVFIRYHRMLGERTLWVFGINRDGVALQVATERRLEKAGKTRYAFTREQFEQKVEEMASDKCAIIGEKLRAIGASPDWSREQYTMDDTYVHAVKRAFVDLYRKDLLYRGDNIVHWCSRCETVVSEQEAKEQEEEGKLYHVRYFVKAADKSILIATTRPETMLGDVAVAVHPDDKRYKEFHDKVLILPVMNKEIPVILDTRVDMNIGTGALKITAAHNVLDFEIARDHGLVPIPVIGKDGNMNKNAGKFAGLDIAQARKNIIEYLDNIGNLEEIIDATIRVKRCVYCQNSIETTLSTQWFLKTTSLVSHIEKNITKGELTFFPDAYGTMICEGENKMRDWWVSRQVWCGHRIPAWYRGDQELYVGEDTPEGSGWVRDENVLDSWFVSALWPFASLGWPKGSGDYAVVYPYAYAEVRGDLSSLWLSRMLMLGKELTGKLPTHTVYFHGVVRDDDGKDISHEEGVVQALYEHYGADVMRLSLVLATQPGNDIVVSLEEGEIYRTYVTKFWNAMRYIITTTQTIPQYEQLCETLQKSHKKLNASQQWILSRLTTVTKEVTEQYQQYVTSHPTRQLLNFTWNEFCDWYLEISKLEENEYTPLVLSYGMMTLLKLWHPVIPFCTEELWKHCMQKEGVMVSSWPSMVDGFLQNSFEKEFGVLVDMVQGIRSLRTERLVEQGKLIEAYIVAKEGKELITSIIPVMQKLARLSKVHICETKPTLAKNVTVAVDPYVQYIALDELIDVAKEKERLEKKIAHVVKQKGLVVAKLANPTFLEHAPVHMVEAQENKFREMEELLLTLRQQRADLD